MQNSNGEKICHVCHVTFQWRIQNFSREATLGAGLQPIIWQQFCLKLYENERNGPGTHTIQRLVYCVILSPPVHVPYPQVCFRDSLTDPIILSASDSDSAISLRFRFGHWRQVNHRCPALNTRMKTITDSLDIDCITGLDTSDN